MKKVLCFLAAMMMSVLTVSAAGKPNIIFILADDLGYTDLGCYGSRYYETPHIDRMAAEGIRFTSGYSAAPNCQPTRAALMSGQYMPRTGVYTVGNVNRFNWQSRPLRPVENIPNLPLEKTILAQAMKKAGYATAMFGKWHLGNEGAYHPAQRGFDEAIESSGVHFDFKTDPETDYPKGQYLADFLTDKAEGFIRRHKDKPFFLYLPHFGVHGPIQAKTNLIEKFKAKAPVGGHHNPVYAAMIASVDESVGRIFAVLKELNIDENTLVIFSSDNGGVGGFEREGIKRAGNTTSNLPLRGGKGMLYEGGIRVPYIFSWPGKIPKQSTTDEVITSVDLYPTLLAIAGAKADKQYPLDGVDYSKVLTSGGKSKLNRDAVYWHFPGYLGSAENTWRTLPVGVIRAGDWKLMEFFEDNRLELYNLQNDLGEQTNIVSMNTKKALELVTQLHAWRKKLNAPMPTPNKAVADTSKAKGKKKKVQ